MDTGRSSVHHRLVLDQLLGAGAFRTTGSSTTGRRYELNYLCGCIATERGIDRFEVHPCPEHHATLRAEQG
jgi:hypothetical protein